VSDWKTALVIESDLTRRTLVAEDLSELGFSVETSPALTPDASLANPSGKPFALLWIDCQARFRARLEAVRAALRRDSSLVLVVLVVTPGEGGPEIDRLCHDFEKRVLFKIAEPDFDPITLGPWIDRFGLQLLLQQER
jgi:hypothetical protein